MASHADISFRYIEWTYSLNENFNQTIDKCYFCILYYRVTLYLRIVSNFSDTFHVNQTWLSLQNRSTQRHIWLLWWTLAKFFKSICKFHPFYLHYVDGIFMIVGRYLNLLFLSQTCSRGALIWKVIVLTY